MKIAILGFSLEGHSSYEYYLAEGNNEISIRDRDESIVVPEGADAVLGPNYLDGLDQFDLIIRTAGLPPNEIIAKNPGIEAKISSQLNEFLKLSPSKNIIGVTGTKGKGTTTTLIAKMLEKSGEQVFIGGNIGVAFFSLLDKVTPESYVVLELSSFQLIDLKASSPHIAICLMVVPEHLNWHADMDEYLGAKTQLFKHQSEGDIAIYFSENDTSKQIASASPGKLIPFFTPPGAHVENDHITIDGNDISAVSELKLLGKHNWQNICAAVTAVWQVTQDISAMHEVLTSFTGLEHRLEFVREINGIKYYNDSFGTTPETAIAAMEAFSQPTVLILGGQPKDVSFEDLGKAVKANEANVHVMVIGQASEQIIKALDQAGYSNYVKSEAHDMPAIVREASELAGKVHSETNQDTIVLLSTANASFDMFKNYKDRGEQFKRDVLKLS